MPPEQRAAAFAARAPSIPQEVIARMQGHLRAQEFPARGMPTTMEDFFRHLAEAGLPPDLVP